MKSVEDSSTKTSKKNQIIATIVSIVVLIIVFAGILPQMGDYETAFNKIKSMELSEIILLLVFTITNILVYVLPYMAALPGLKYRPGFVLRQTSFLISNSVPAGGAIGLGVQYAMLGSYGFKGSSASSAILLTGAWNMLATVSLPGVSAVLLLLTGQLNYDSAVAAIFGIIIAIIALGGFLIVFRSATLAEKIGNILDKIIHKLAKLFKKSIKSTLTKSVMDFRESAYDVTIKRWRLLTSSNYLQQLGQFSVLFVALQILDPDSITFISALGAFAIARLGTFIPLTPGGVGTVDALLVSALVKAGVDNDIALAATLIWRFATFVPQVILGIITFIYWRYKVRPTTS